LFDGKEIFIFSESFKNAPGEKTLGLMAGIVLVYSVLRLIKILSRDFNLTPALVLQALLQVRTHDKTLNVDFQL
jgi:hypothetical protein